MFQSLTKQPKKSAEKKAEPKTLAELVAENQRLGREVDALRDARRAINTEIAARIAKGER